MVNSVCTCDTIVKRKTNIRAEMGLRMCVNDGSNKLSVFLFCVAVFIVFVEN